MNTPDAIEAERKLSEREQRLLDAAREFQAAFDRVLPDINSCIAMSEIHGAPYTGGSLVPEIDALRAALAAYKE